MLQGQKALYEPPIQTPELIIQLIMNPWEQKPDNGKEHYIFNTHSKWLTNHNTMGQLINQSSLGFSERRALKRPKAFQAVKVSGTFF